MNSTTRKPVKLFISYSHKDQKHLDKLITHLAGLEGSGSIRCWWDGEIELGKDWQPQLIEALRRADIVLMLITANFLKSKYCVETELQLAKEREKQGQIDLLPIWVDEVEFGDHWLGRLQAIKVKSRRGSAAWVSVAKQINLKVQCMRGGRPVMQVLNEVDEVVHSGDVGLANLPPHQNALKADFPTVSAFWKAKSTVLPDLDYATVQGTLSQFAPMLMGPPGAKRVLHREFRKAIEAHRGFGERKRLTINACMSISAGQMVHHEVRSGNRKRLLGLYESIVRNSIPVFALAEYYDEVLVPLFRDTQGSGCLEVSVTGKLFKLENSYIRRFLVKQGIDQIIQPYVIDELCKDSYALEVGGPGTEVRQLVGQPVRYLDGDIWVVARSAEEERFITAFVDITNPAERDEEMRRLREDAGNSRLIATYDQLQSVAQLIEQDDE